MGDKFRNLAPIEMIASVYNDQEAFADVTRWEKDLEQIEKEFTDLYKLLSTLKIKEYENSELLPSDEEDKVIILEKIELLKIAGSTITKELRRVRAKFTWQPRQIIADEKLPR